jgi:hypothetical protein
VNRVEVVDQVPLGRSCLIEKLLIKVGEGDVIWQSAAIAHGLIIAGRGRRRREVRSDLLTTPLRKVHSPNCVSYS